MRRTRYRFQEFEIDPPSRDLLRDGERVALPPKSFDCLAYLVVHRDRAVGRDELIAAVWGRVEVSDMVVAQTMLRARKAVGDSGTLQRTIRTVTRFGYQWIAPVQELELGAGAPRVPSQLASSALQVARNGARRWLGWSGVLLLAGVIGFSGWLLARAAPRPMQDSFLQGSAHLPQSLATMPGSAVTPAAPRCDRVADVRTASPGCVPAPCAATTPSSGPGQCPASPAKGGPAASRANRLE